jgi:hypothetical protein
VSSIPPYGREIGQWVRKARAEVTDGRAELVAALLPARTDTSWWHQEIAGCAQSVMLRGRLSFGDGTPAPFPSALVFWGAGPQQIAALRAEFPTAWHIDVGNLLQLSTPAAQPHLSAVGGGG